MAERGLRRTASSWQLPFVNVLARESTRCEKSGGVAEIMDKVINKRCWRIKGAVSATTYMDIGGQTTSKNGLKLTGRFLYLQLRPLNDKDMVIHVDVALADGTQLRLSFSSLYKDVKAVGRSVRAPLAKASRGGSKQGKSQGGGGSTSRMPSTSWTVVAVDMQQLLSHHPHAQSSPFSHIRHIKLCSTMIIRGVYTSAIQYSTIDLPKEMALPVPPGKGWDSCYSWTWLPSLPTVPNVDPSFHKVPLERLESKKVQHARRRTEKRHFAQGSKLLGARVRDERELEAEIELVVDTLKEYSESMAPPRRGCTPSSPSLHHTKSHEVPGSSKRREQLKKQQAAAMAMAGGGETDDESAMSGMAPAVTVLGGPPDPALVTRVVSAEERVARDLLEPDPALEVTQMIGTGSSTGGAAESGPNCLAWASSDSLIAMACNETVVLMEPRKPRHPDQEDEVVDPSAADDAMSHQSFLLGHTDVVTHLELSTGGQILASAQAGEGHVRLWDCSTHKCSAHFLAHDTAIVSMSFSSDDKLLCTVGQDIHRRTQIIVWDVATVVLSRKQQHGITRGMAIAARQMSDFPITTIKFSPYDKLRLVSCGKENIRFWRIKRNHLPACPAILNQFARGASFTDLAFESPYTMSTVREPADAAKQRIIYIASEAGTLLQVNYFTRNLLCVLKLHDGPINSIAVNEGFAVTASSDQYLRVWPLDFTDYLMEARHESAVTRVTASQDGLKLGVMTAKGCIGILDVTTHAYTSLMRSHTGKVVALAIRPSQDSHDIATASDDNTIRVWDGCSYEQVYEFTSTEDSPVSLAYHPFHTHLVSGFESGCVRVFNTPSTSTIFEHQQHSGEVQQVLFSPDASRLFSAGSDGVICVYDVNEGYQPLKVVATDAPQPNQPLSLAVSPCGSLLAVVGSEPSAILLYNTQNMVLARRFAKEKAPGVRMAWGGDEGMAAIAKSKDPVFRHVGFSSDGGDLIACTNTKAFRFGVSGMASDSQPWSAVLPTRGRPIASLLPGAYPWMMLTAEGNEVELCQIKHGDDSPAMSISVPQGFTAHWGQATVTCAAFSADGSLVVTCDDTGKVIIWDYQGDPVPPSDPHHQAATLVVEGTALKPNKPLTYELRPDSSDDDLYGSDSDESSKGDGPLKVVLADPARDLQQKLKGSEEGAVLGFLRAPDIPSPLKAAAEQSDAPGPYRPDLLSPIAPQAIQHSDTLKQLGKVTGDVIWHAKTGVLYSTCGTLVAVEDVKTGKKIPVIGHDHPITTMALDNSGRLLATGGEAQASSLLVWEKTPSSSSHAFRLLFDLPANSSVGVHAVRFTPDSKYLVALGKWIADENSQAIHVYNVTSSGGGGIKCSAVVTQPLHSLATLDGTRGGFEVTFATCGNFGTTIWSCDSEGVGDGELMIIGQRDVCASETSVLVLVGDAYLATFSEDFGAVVAFLWASVGDDEAPQLLRWPISSHCVTSMHGTPGGKLLVAGVSKSDGESGSGGQITVFDVNDCGMHPIKGATVQLGQGMVPSSMSWSPQAECGIVSGQDGSTWFVQRGLGRGPHQMCCLHESFEEELS